MSNKESLIKAKSLLTPQTFIQGGYLVDGSNQILATHLAENRYNAKKMCATGALCITLDTSIDGVGKLESKLDKAASELFHAPSIVFVNDTFGLEAVLNCYDLAIKNCED